MSIEGIKPMYIELYTHKGSWGYMGKRKLNLSIDEVLIKKIKHISIEEDTNISGLVEEYIKAIVKNRNVLKAIKDMNK